MEVIMKKGEQILRLCTCEDIEEAKIIAASFKIKKISHTICRDCTEALYPGLITEEELKGAYVIIPKKR